MANAIPGRVILRHPGIRLNQTVGSVRHNKSAHYNCVSFNHIHLQLSFKSLALFCSTKQEVLHRTVSYGVRQSGCQWKIRNESDMWGDLETHLGRMDFFFEEVFWGWKSEPLWTSVSCVGPLTSIKNYVTFLLTCIRVLNNMLTQNHTQLKEKSAYDVRDVQTKWQSLQTPSSHASKYGSKKCSISLFFCPNERADQLRCFS